MNLILKWVACSRYREGFPPSVRLPSAPSLIIAKYLLHLLYNLSICVFSIGATRNSIKQFIVVVILISIKSTSSVTHPQ